MSSPLAGVNMAVIGGDDRELYLIPALTQMGAKVSVAGISKLSGDRSIRYCRTIEEVVQYADFVILPVPGIDDRGIVRAKYTEEPLQLNSYNMLSFKPDCTIIVGFARPLLKKLAADRKLKLVEITDIDEMAILNSIPSAEGAIQMAMENTNCTIHGSNVLILGFGRCGMTLARVVTAMGAHTSVAARKATDLARITEMGLKPVTYNKLVQEIGSADIVFNTVPAPLLNKEILSKVKADAYICDIASAPGGVDYEAAHELGIKAHLAPSLPGKVAPKTAGQVLAEIIPRVIVSELSLRKASEFSQDEREGCTDEA